MGTGTRQSCVVFGTLPHIEENLPVECERRHSLMARSSRRQANIRREGSIVESLPLFPRSISRLFVRFIASPETAGKDGVQPEVHGREAGRDGRDRMLDRGGVDRVHTVRSSYHVDMCVALFSSTDHVLTASHNPDLPITHANKQ